MQLRVVGIVAGLVLAATLGFAAPAQAATIALAGEVTYRERMALPEGATLRIVLVDMTASGSPTRLEAEAPVASPGQVPLTFMLNFDDRAIDPTHDHGLIAEISAGGQVWFRNVEPYALVSLPPEGPILILAQFAGRQSADAVEAAAPDAADPALLETTWRATSIAGEPVFAGVDSTLTITGDSRAGGRGGCNSYFAQAAVSATMLRLSAMGATRMACLSANATDQETRFLAALGATHAWRIEGEVLVLFDDAGNELVRLARALR